jgi:D-amino-acid oxidase
MRVAVLGAGISGLTTAARLLEAGCRVRVVADAAIESSTSYLAAAVWFPTHVGPADRVSDWGIRTYDVFAEQAARGIPGVVMRESLALYREPPETPDWADAVRGVRAATAAELPHGYQYGLRFVVPLVEMPLYLPWLAERVRADGAEMHRRRIHSLQELAEDGVDAIVNCSGLAARELVGDESIYPVRGQIVRVTNPGLTMSVRDEKHPAGRAYVHPRAHDCILGGTLEHSWDTRVDLETAESILRRCRDIAPALAEAAVIEHVVGLRPARPVVRLEEGAVEDQGPRILHNYGHGGAGITISWGCADEVASLL